MPVRPWALTFTLLALSALSASAQGPKSAEVLSFDRDVKPILRKRCANCHNPERPRGELELTSFAGVVAGGAGGKSAVAGKPEESLLYTLPAHLEDPKMPPNAPRIPQKEIDAIRRWIEGGMIERSGDAVPDPTAAMKTETPGGNLVAPVSSPRGNAITALAVSPVAPFAAVSGYRQILLFDLGARKILGALPFPEGDVFALRFSRDGQTLLAAGGLGAESGKVALFETKDWSRRATLGDEVDAILAADLSPDGSRVVVGGPTRAVKLLANPGGEVLQTFRKPTDWVTAAAFSPDGLLVAAGDRFGGLFVWEARAGKEFLTLRGHTRSITAIAWSPAADHLVTAGEDGAIQVWNLHDGKVASRWEAHEGGVLWAEVHPSGRIASAGRDRRVRVWDLGGKPLADFGPGAQPVTRLSWASDGRSLLSGDLAGEVRTWNLVDATSASLPMPVAPPRASMAMVTPALTPARAFVNRPAAAPPASARVGGTQPAADDLDAALAAAREAAAAADRAVAGLARLAEARSRTAERDPATAGRSASNGEALRLAGSALNSLRAALAADPGNAPLARALEETERGVKLLEERRDRLTSTSRTTTGDR